MDPELARYRMAIERLFKKNFNPLPTIRAANPDIDCEVNVRIDMNTGRVLSVKMIRTSGNASYDGAAMRAAEAVPQVPLPPERFQSEIQRIQNGGFTIRFGE